MNRRHLLFGLLAAPFAALIPRNSKAPTPADEVHVTFTTNVRAMDRTSVERLLEKHADTFQRHLRVRDRAQIARTGVPLKNGRMMLNLRKPVGERPCYACEMQDSSGNVISVFDAYINADGSITT